MPEEIPDPPACSARLATNLGTDEVTSPGTSEPGQLTVPVSLLGDSPLFRRRPVTSGLARSTSSAWSPSPSGPPFECVGNAGKGLGQGRQVPVIHTPAIQRDGELG